MKIAYVVTCRTDRFSVNGPQTPRHRDVLPTYHFRWHPRL